MCQEVRNAASAENLMEELKPYQPQLPPLGKKILDDLYVHTDYLDRLKEFEPYRQLIDAAIAAIPSSEFQFCNVAKINVHRNKLSFLQYLDFEVDPFPTLNGSWVFDFDTNAIKFRSYASSLNPPILHRKELLVAEDHPQHNRWAEITNSAEQLGFFSSGQPIGFKLNWLKLLREKGFSIEGDQFLPLGNQIESIDNHFYDLNAPIQRHLTALSRSSLSAPMQLMISNGLISSSVDVFDYGCGRGDDVKGLTEIGCICNGWDPYYAIDNRITSADIVNLGFVVNVIEDPAERVEALQKSFALAKRALVVSVMLHGKDRPGKPYLDGFLTSRGTFQKYFTQEEFKDYLESVLAHEPFMLGPGIGLIFSNKQAEQHFLLGRYRSSHVARRLLGARISPIAKRFPRHRKEKIPRLSRAQQEFDELRPILEKLWAQTLDLGRFPEPSEIIDLDALLEKVSLVRAKRLLRSNFDQSLLERSEKTRSDEIRIFLAARQFSKRSPYKELEERLKTDIKHFFGDYKAANQSALRLLLESADPDRIREGCEEAASDGLGYLEDNSHSLQIHVSLVERLPSVLRAFVNCGLLLWNNLDEFQLIKIHVASGKLTLLQYDDFDNLAIPSLIKRVKINIPKLDYDVFEYATEGFPPPPLLFKSRFMHEELQGYAQQVEFDEMLDACGVLDKFETPKILAKIQEQLGLLRLEISGLKLQNSTTIPDLDDPCGQYLTFRELVHCGETQARLGLPNLPLNPKTYNALYALSKHVLDPVIEYFGAIKLTYGFCSDELRGKIKSRIAPKLDQHSSHECNRQGKLICERLGAAVDFLVEDDDMYEVALWIAENLPFDRMYLYGDGKPIHISYSIAQSRLVSLMIPTKNGRLMPRTCSSQELPALLNRDFGK